MEKTCTLLVHFDKGTRALANKIKEWLEGSDTSRKVEAMTKAVMLLLNGETLPQLFITIVRYVLPSTDHTIQKLLLLYLEIIDKTDAQGKILPEMILRCQNLRNNLQHPNEYIRAKARKRLLKEGRVLLDSTDRSAEEKLRLLNSKYQQQEEKKTLERELARAEITANKVAVVVANEWKDQNDKVMPVRQWLEERRFMQGEMQQLRDKLAASEKTAKNKSQLKEKLQVRLKVLEDGLKPSNSTPTRLPASEAP